MDILQILNTILSILSAKLQLHTDESQFGAVEVESDVVGAFGRHVSIVVRFELYFCELYLADILR